MNLSWETIRVERGRRNFHLAGIMKSTQLIVIMDECLKDSLVYGFLQDFPVEP